MKITIDPGVIDYLAGVTGETPWIEPMPDQIVSTLPLYLRQRYEFFRTDLFGRQCVLARENSPTEELSPTEYGHEVTQLKQRLHEDVVLVLYWLSISWFPSWLSAS